MLFKIKLLYKLNIGGYIMGGWFFGLLGMLFIALKLTNIIAWSWWLVVLIAFVMVKLDE